MVRSRRDTDSRGSRVLHLVLHGSHKKHTAHLDVQYVVHVSGLARGSSGITNTQETKSKQLRQSHKSIDLASSSARTPRIFVRYEDLLLQPRRTLQRLCPLFGARPTADVRLPTRGSSPKEFKAVYTNAARLTNATAALQPYTLADRAIMESKMGETMRLLGYRLP